MTHEFRDTTGRQWPLVLTVATLRRLRDRGQDWLADPLAKLRAAAGDPWLIYDALPVILADRLEEAGLTPEDLFAAFDGAVAHAAQEAFVDAFMAFFRPLRPTEIDLLETAAKETEITQAQLAPLARRHLLTDLETRRQKAAADLAAADEIPTAGKTSPT